MLFVLLIGHQKSHETETSKEYKKFEPMLMRRVKAYSSSCSVV